VFISGWLIQRSKLGLALRVIGDDEAVARHVGINTTMAKVVLFAFSASFMTLAGAVMAPRWTYIDPAIAFNPVVSFQVLIMALLGGVHRLYGPVFGVIPLALLFEFLLAKFPNHFSIMVGLAFSADRLCDPARHRRPDRRRAAFLEPDEGSESMSAPLLSISRLTRRFGGLVAVDGVTLEVRPGEIVGLLGPNGSGKTTVLNLISGALKSDAGSIQLRGRPLEKLPAFRIAREGVARTFQLVRVLGSMTCKENVIAGLAFGAKSRWGEEASLAAQELLARVGLANARECHDFRAHLYRPEAARARAGAGDAARVACCSTNGWRG
jgi:branched-chain amino acid transport system permease protein